jgi:hypothetical protein
MSEMRKCQTGIRGQWTHSPATNTAFFVDFRFARRRMPATSVPTKIIEKTVIITHLKIAGRKITANYSEVLRQELQEASEQGLHARLATSSKIP